jgi:hypothetical protein
MNAEYINKYVDYIGLLFRETEKITKNKDLCTDNWVILVSSYSELASLDSILGMSVYVTDSISDDFKLCIPAENENQRKFLKEFCELQREIGMQ